MGTVYINARCRKILDLLLAGDRYITLQRLTDEIKVSKRSFYYDLCKINEWLEFYKISEIVVERGKGILLSPENKKKIEDILNKERGSDEYIFSPIERVKIIICYIIHWGEPVYIGKLSEYCQVSRNTIFNDLQVVVKQLQEYGLALAYESKQGYRIEGDIIRIRALFFLYFGELLTLFNAGVLNFIDREEIRRYHQHLKKIETEMQVEYVEGILLSLSALLPLMYQRKEKPYFQNLRREEVEKTQEYGLIRKYFDDLDENEQIYLCIHLLGSRIAVAGNKMFEDQADQTVYEIAKTLVAEFEKAACVTFEEREELERSLFTHISTSLYRYQYGIQIGNPMSEDVTREYPNIVSITKLVSKYLSQSVGLPIPDSEVAYLALHFGAHLKIAEKKKEQLRVMIVCVNGMATGNMLRREVQKLLPNARIVKVAAAVDMDKVQEQCDLIISTVKIESIVPVVVVRPILTDFDRKTILSYQIPVQKQKQDERDNLFKIVKKYVREEDYNDLKADLDLYFQGDISKSYVKRDRESRGLLYFLEKNEITVTQETFIWHEAVWFAGKQLLANESIEKRYLETIISQIRYYGPYMFIAKGLVLAHARPEDGVNHLDVSLTVFKSPVRFAGVQEAQVIITLATEDQEKHLKILKDIMLLFAEDDSNCLQDMLELKNAEEIMYYLKEKLR